MNEQYSRSYTTLKLRPGASWDELRVAYHALIKQWHPDRFQRDGGERRRLAEEKTKEITRAYKTLADYYRKHGQTPTDNEATPAAHEMPAAGKAPADQAGQGTVDDNSPANHQRYSPVSIPVRPPIGWKAFFALIAVVALLYAWQLEPSSDNDTNSSVVAGSATADASRPGPADNGASKSADRFFTRGTTIGEVYSIQGIPSETEEGIWHYGKSKVYFANGSVSHWESHPDNPLKASHDIEPANRSKEFFSRGSTKTEVRAIQGTPWRQTEHEWTYGSSRVFFSGELVTSWEESPLHPLKIK